MKTETRNRKMEDKKEKKQNKLEREQRKTDEEQTLFLIRPAHSREVVGHHYSLQFWFGCECEEVHNQDVAQGR